MFLCRKWGNTDVIWNLANWTWSECQLVEEVLTEINRSGIDASKIYDNYVEQPWVKNEEKKKRLIKLICKIKGETYDETKEVKDNIKITVKDIKLVVKTVSNIDLNINS